MKFLRSILSSEVYHGAAMKPLFFEGWYFKVVDASVIGKQSYPELFSVRTRKTPNEVDQTQLHTLQKFKLENRSMNKGVNNKPTGLKKKPIS